MRIKSTITAILVWAAVFGLAPRLVIAQAYNLYSIEFRSVDLAEALQRFSQMTGTGVTFDPSLTDQKRTTCAISKSLADEILTCILESSGLDYVQLSSGTYVITEVVEKEPVYGTIAGDIRDHLSGNPLPDAHILLASNFTEIRAISNRNGQFSLPPLLPGKYLLSTSYLGYHDIKDTLVVVPGQHTFRKIEMVEEPIIFTPVVIDGIQRRQSASSLDHTLLLLSDSLIAGQISSNESVIQQVASVPGVRFNNLTADTHLQGSGAGEHQFKLDGVPIFLPQRAIGILGPFSPFALESIQIHKSGFGVQEGSYLAGVMSARHKLSDQEGLELHFDPLSVSSRYVNSIDTKKNHHLQLMASLRTSVWDIYKQPQMQSTLNTWSRPDPFLIFGPVKRYSEVDPTFFQTALNISSVPTTDVSFLDLHFAGKLALNPFSAVSFSGYGGRNNLKGFLPHVFTTTEDRLLIDNNTVELGSVSPAPLSIADQYKWRNSAGQINYHTLFGKHTLFNIQARASFYDLTQTYKIVEGLLEIIDSTPGVDDENENDEVFGLPILENQEKNDIVEYALESRIERAFRNHYLSAGLELTRTESSSDLVLPSLTTNTEDNTSPTGLQRIEYAGDVARIASYISERMDLGNRTVEFGVRATYIVPQQKVFVEPRMSIRFDHEFKSGGTFAARTAVGLYRQYLLQFDVSTLNAGALFPSKRIWIPVDEQIQPPMAIHFTQSFLLMPSENLTFRLEGYAKHLERTHTLNYYIEDPIEGAFVDTGFESINLTSANNPLAAGFFLSLAHSFNMGGTFSIEWQKDPVYFRINYDYSSIKRRSLALFEDSWTTVPWNEPHRLGITIQTDLVPNLFFTVRFTGVWGRSWGFRQAYYDFFGHQGATRIQSPFDFGNPSDHILPPIYQVDLSLAHHIQLKNSTLQFRLDLINALDAKNVADWRLLWVEDHLRIENRYLYPRIPSLSLRLSL